MEPSNALFIYNNFKKINKYLLIFIYSRMFAHICYSNNNSNITTSYRRLC